MGVPRDRSGSGRQATRRGAALMLGVILVFGAGGQALADTPLRTAGYLSNSYYVPPSSPTDGPAQAKLWFTDGTWSAGRPARPPDPGSPSTATG